MKKKLMMAIIAMVCVSFLSVSGHAKGTKKQYSGQLNLNQASKEELDQLPGVSPQKAEAIVEYRKEHPFKSIDELDNVKGFSPKSIEKIKPYLALQGASSLKVEGGSSGKKSGAGKSHKKKASE